MANERASGNVGNTEKTEAEIYRKEFTQEERERFPDGHVRHIADGVYGVFRSKGDLSYYIRESGSVMLNLRAFRRFQFVENGEAVKASGFVEKRIGDVRVLYRAGTDSNGKAFAEKEPVNPYTKEYLDAWMLMYFNQWRIETEVFKKNSKESFSDHELSQQEGNFWLRIPSGSVTIDDMEILASQKKVSPEFKDKAIKRIAEEQLVSQCSDPRLDDVLETITQEKIDRYLKSGYIDERKHSACSEIIRTRSAKRTKEVLIRRRTAESVREMKEKEGR